MLLCTSVRLYMGDGLLTREHVVRKLTQVMSLWPSELNMDFIFPQVPDPQTLAEFWLADIQLTTGEKIETFCYPKTIAHMLQNNDKPLEATAAAAVTNLLATVLELPSIELVERYLEPRIVLVLNKRPIYDCNHQVNDLLLHGAHYWHLLEQAALVRKPLKEWYVLPETSFQYQVARWINDPWQQKVYVAKFLKQHKTQTTQAEQIFSTFVEQVPTCWSCLQETFYIGVFCFHCAQKYLSFNARLDVISKRIAKIKQLFNKIYL